MSQGILRNYRSIPPTKFHSLNQRIATSLADKTRIPDSTWAANPSLLPSYLAASAKHDALYHESMLGSKLVIQEREVLQSQLMIYLDQIALILEMAAVHTPGILIASGFDTVKDRRWHNRNRAVPAAPEAPNAAPGDQGEGGDGSAT